jgi:RNA polymerase sigma-70 factor (ECF subfamily)
VPTNSDTVEMSDVPDHSQPAEERIESHEEVERLLGELQGQERDIVRMYHLEGKSYHEIGESLKIGKNTIGPILSRARAKMRQVGVE